MKKKSSMTFGQKLAYFFKRYTVSLLLALVCGTLTVMLVALVALV